MKKTLATIALMLGVAIAVASCEVYVDPAPACPVNCYNGNCCPYNTVCNNYYLTCDRVYYYLREGIALDAGVPSDGGEPEVLYSFPSDDAGMTTGTPQFPAE